MDKYVNANDLINKILYRRGSHYEFADTSSQAKGMIKEDDAIIEEINSISSSNVVEIPVDGIEELSDGYHTFNQLYYQRMVLFATIVKQNKEFAWKSLRHKDGELCFGGDWFIVGIDTPEGSYTYHYEMKFWFEFDCQILERGKHWDGHTEKDVTRLLSLTKPKETKYGKWFLCNRNGLILTKLPRHHGTNFYGYKCSNCNYIYHGSALIECSFCPHCGVNMRGETDA